MKTREAFTAQHHALLFALVAQRELGSAGFAASQAALKTFSARFGPSMADILAGDAGADFDALPEGR